jgi:glycosyltransferase involved in cell wall biosynthesis
MSLEIARLMNSPDSPYLLWLGAIFDEASLLTQPAISPAANRWQSGLIFGLRHHGLPVHSIGHLPEAMWPKGRLRISSSTARIAPDIEGELIGYPNLPRIRIKFLEQRYKRRLDAVIQHLGAPLAVLSYNAYPYNVAAAELAQKKYGLPWICVVADVPGSESEWPKHDRDLERAAGRIYLSWSRMQSSGLSPNLHLDGTADGIKLDRILSAGSSHAESGNGIKTVLFTGAMNKWAGVDYLVSAFSTLDRADIRLQLCGPGKPTTETLKMIDADSRIEFLGLVSESRLRELSTSTNVFVNPRPSKIPGNESNFPSKILEYLTYGKPIISTITPGISPDYHDILIPVKQETDEGLAAAISHTVDLSMAERKAIYERTVTLIDGSKTRESQANRLIDWMRSDLNLAI